MNKYTIYCTEEQETKAFELGANIIKVEEDFNAVPTCYVDKSDDLYEIPTAEQMIGWLEEHGIKEISIYGTNADKWNYDIWIIYGQLPITKSVPIYDSRKEVTLAAIDATLDYLSKK